MSSGEKRIECDIAIIGGGVLGVSLYHWITSLSRNRVILMDKERSEAMHTSSRNTGVVHRPFYLDPVKKRAQARSAGLSYFMWRDLAKLDSGPWNQCGTVEVITSDSGHSMLEKYSKWSIENGLTEDDFDILTGQEVSEIENEVRCVGAIHSKTDVSTAFGVLTGLLLRRSRSDSGRVMFNSRVTSIEEDKSGCSVRMNTSDGNVEIRCKVLINAAGGSSLDIAHSMGYAEEYSVLFFRGEYWKVGKEYTGKIRRNIYTVPRHTGYPFLDPHFIIKANGSREIGPNAVLVGGPEVYRGLSGHGSSILNALLDSPVEPKMRLLFNREFLRLVSSEWKSSLYKNEMANRVRSFIPSVDARFLIEPGIAGVRASLIDNSGFVPEAVPVFGTHSVHILNYNSPGATGAPAFAAYLLEEMAERGFLNPLEGGPTISSEWDFQKVSAYMSGD